MTRARKPLEPEDQQRNHVTDPDDHEGAQGNLAPGDEHTAAEGVSAGIRGYLIGLVLATGMTCVSFFLAQSHLVWAPSIPIALSTMAVAQMGVHLVFFLHLTTGKDSVNNVLALAFGLLIVMIVVFGSIWIMSHMNHMMPSMDQIMKMQR